MPWLKVEESGWNKNGNWVQKVTWEQVPVDSHYPISGTGYQNSYSPEWKSTYHEESDCHWPKQESTDQTRWHADNRTPHEEPDWHWRDQKGPDHEKSRWHADNSTHRKESDWHKPEDTDHEKSRWHADNSTQRKEMDPRCKEDKRIQL